MVPRRRLMRSISGAFTRKCVSCGGKTSVRTAIMTGALSVEALSRGDPAGYASAAALMSKALGELTGTGSGQRDCSLRSPSPGECSDFKLTKLVVSGNAPRRPAIG